MKLRSHNTRFKRAILNCWFMGFVLLLLVQCSSERRGESLQLPYTHVPGNYFTDTVVVEFSKNFSVSYHGNYKVVKAKVPHRVAGGQEDSVRWNNAFTDVMVLVQNGTNPPPLVGALKDATVIVVPVQRMAGNSDDSPTRFTALGKREKIVGLGHIDIYDEYLKSRVDSGYIQPIGASWQASPNLEILVQLKPDITFLTIASMVQSEGLKKTRSMGLPSAPDFSWSESSYLAQLEWIKYDAVFMNAEKEATNYFNEIKYKCDSLKNLVMGIKEKPRVMWGMHKKGLWTVRVNDSFAKLMEDAGAINAFGSDGGIVNETVSNGLSEGVTIPDEVVFKELPSLNYIISFQSTTENWPPQTFMSTSPAYRHEKLYHHFKRYKDYGGHDWYQTASMRPDLVLKDLIGLFHPQVIPNHGSFFFNRITVVKEAKKS